MGFIRNPGKQEAGISGSRVTLRSFSVIALKGETRRPLATPLRFSVPCRAAASGWQLALRCLRSLLFRVRLPRGGASGLGGSPAIASSTPATQLLSPAGHDFEPCRNSDTRRGRIPSPRQRLRHPPRIRKGDRPRTESPSLTLCYVKRRQPGFWPWTWHFPWPGRALHPFQRKMSTCASPMLPRGCRHVDIFGPKRVCAASPSLGTLWLPSNESRPLAMNSRAGAADLLTILTWLVHSSADNLESPRTRVHGP